MKERRAHPRREVLSEAEAERAADVFTTHQRFVENVARQYAPGPDHVPDIVQQVGLQVCKGLNGYRGDAELKTWLYRVTVNVARDHYRAERRHLLRPREAVAAEPMPEPVIDPDEQAHVGERLQALHDAVERLKPLYRHLMRDEMTGTAVLSSRKHARHRARQRLRDLLTDDPRLE